MKKAYGIMSFSAVLLWSTFALGADVVPPVIDLPGTQPNEMGGFESPGRCDNCHGGYDTSTYSTAPAFGWKGSAMGNAGRDPIFWATVAIAEQDFDGAGDLCIRCHSAGGWIEGRSTPTDGSGLAASDEHGIDCDTCHLSTNTDNSEHVGIMLEPFVANSPIDGEGFYGSGMLSIWGAKEKLGPYTADDALAKHQRMQSAFHRSEDFCGTCHDVSNSAVGHFAPNFGAQPGAVANVITDGPRVHPDPDHILGTNEAYVGLNNPPYAYGIVERTFSEYKASGFTGMPISNFSNLPADLQVAGGALEKAANSPAGDTYDDGTPRYFTCQSCHMRATEGYGANKNGIPYRHDLAMHDLTGGNHWIAPLIQYQDQQGTLRLGGGLVQTQIDAMNAGVIRAEDSLRSTVSMDVTGDTVKLTNLTGHKAITGYPEGRRMWLNIKWYDSGGALLREDGAYGGLGFTVTNPVDGSTFEPQSLLDLHDPNTKIYEAHYGMTKEWADVLLSVGYSPDMALSFDRYTGAVDYTLGDLAANTGAWDSHETFHFAINNHVIKDNRIPPYGMNYDIAEERNCLPVPDTQYGNPGSGGTYNYWDNVALNPPTGATGADITLYYQGTSWEYVQFLWKANNTPAGEFLADEGVNMLDAWVKTGMVPPLAIETATWGTPICVPTTEGPFGDATCSDGVDNDCDELTDAADPDCQQTTLDCTTIPDQATCEAEPTCRWNRKQGCLNR